MANNRSRQFRRLITIAALSWLPVFVASVVIWWLRL